MKRAMLLLVTLAGCHFGPKPDLELNHRTEFFWNKHPPVKNLQAVVDSLYDDGQTLCEHAGNFNLPVFFCASVTFEDIPFACENTGPEKRYIGCQPYFGQCVFQVGWEESAVDTTMIDEVGHFIWEACLGRVGEHGGSGEGIYYDQDFAAWLNKVRVHARMRLGQ